MLIKPGEFSLFPPGFLLTLFETGAVGRPIAPEQLWQRYGFLSDLYWTCIGLPFPDPS